MSKFQKITTARKILELPEKATAADIKANYRRLLAAWHPDKNAANQETCTEMTRKIIAAHKTITEYCQQYQYSFSQETVKRHRSPEEWLFEQFVEPPLAGEETEE